MIHRPKATDWTSADYAADPTATAILKSSKTPREHWTFRLETSGVIVMLGSDCRCRIHQCKIVAVTTMGEAESDKLGDVTLGLSLTAGANGRGEEEEEDFRLSSGSDVLRLKNPLR